MFMMDDKAFLGKGLAFPLQVNPRGEVAMASGDRDIEQSIRIILGTAPGERVMRPEFGCRIHELIFAPRDASTEGLLVEYVEQALGWWEPRIDVGEVKITSNPRRDGAVFIRIQYQIKSVHDERSIVYPFFFAAEEE